MNRSGRISLASGVLLAFALLLSAPAPAADAEVTGKPVERSAVAGAPSLASIPPSPSDFDGKAEATEPESLGWTLLSTLLSLGAIVALIYLTLNFGLRRMMAMRGLPFARAGLVKVVERVTLDPKRALFVVEAAGEYLLIGGGDQGLSLIARLDPSEVNRLLQRPERSSAPSPFLEKLLFRKGDAPPGGRA